MILHDGVRVTFWPQGGSTEVLFSTDRTGLSEAVLGANSVPADGRERENQGKKGGVKGGGVVFAN